MLKPSALGLAMAVLGAACNTSDVTVPLDHPVFPTGLAVSADGAHLVVVSSDFDLAFADGAVLVADLTAVRAAVADGDETTVVADAYGAGAILPPFGDKPLLSPNGDRILVPTRGTNLISSIDLSADGALGCGSGFPRCGTAPFALQLTANDPFELIALDQSSDGKRFIGLATALSSSVVTFFSDDRSKAGSEQMQITGALDLGAAISGVRSAVLRPATATAADVVIAAADLATVTGAAAGAELVLFEPTANSALRSLDVTATTGALTMRDLVLVPGNAGQPDAVIAVLRGPDGVARFEIDDLGGLPSLRMTALQPSCRGPTSLAAVHLTTPAGEVDRVLLTCQTSDAVLSLDPVSLTTTDALRFLGRGPYDVVVSTATAPPQAYVSSFLDNSIGVIDLVDADGYADLVPRGRIGAASEKPEDGRQ